MLGVGPMTQVSIETAGDQLDQLVEQAARGEDVVLLKGSEAVARIVPIRHAQGPRRPGTARGLILHIADDFDAPLEEFKDYS